MGTTLTVLLTDGEQVALVHVGDSRAYLLRDGELTQLTRDQTYVQTLVDAGVLTREEVRRHPRSNVVLQAVDAEHPADAGPRPGRRTRRGPAAGLLRRAQRPGRATRRSRACLEQPTPEDAVAALVDAALAAGGRDNVTCLVSDVVDGPRVVPDGLRHRRVLRPVLVVDPAAVHALPG